MSETKQPKHRSTEVLEQKQREALSFLEKAYLLAKQRKAEQDAKNAKENEKLKKAEDKQAAAEAVRLAKAAKVESAKLKREAEAEAKRTKAEAKLAHKKAPKAKSPHTRVEHLERHAKAICKSYNENASLRELAKRFNTTLPMITRVLHANRVEMRAPGRVAGKPSPGYDIFTKISPAQQTWILAEDLRGTEYKVIGDKLGVSRERIRQICLAAGHQPKRVRMRIVRTRLALQGEEQRIRRKLDRQEQLDAITTEISTAATLWAKGLTIEGIAKKLKQSPNSMGVHIARWRARHPDLFPRRYQPQPT